MTGRDSIDGAEECSYQTLIPPDLLKRIEALVPGGDEGLQKLIVQLLEFSVSHPQLIRISDKDLELVGEFIRLLFDGRREYKAFRDMLLEVLQDRLEERVKAATGETQPSGRC
jgi:hypothetical protein